MAKTQYQGATSDNRDESGHSHNSAVIEGRALPGKLYPPEQKQEAWNLAIWKKSIADQIWKKIDSGELKKIQSECNLYVNFYLHSGGNRPDTDNLLKAFLDPLQEKYGSDENPKDGGGLVENDRMFRGIRAEREIISKDEKERVEFKYLIAKTFEIIKVSKVTVEEGDESLKSYRSYWNDPMQVIRAREVGVDYSGREDDYFIDNAYGAVHVTRETRDKFPDVIPGYDWKEKEKKLVEGCMVFRRKHRKLEADQGQGKSSSFYWLKKWPNPF